jgi:hypothetical protein
MTAVAAVSRASILAENANAIRSLGKQTVENIIEIGFRLAYCRDNHLQHGEWLPWLEREFNWSRRTAGNFIHVYEAAERRSANFANLGIPVSGLYMLASPSTPEKARDEIIKRAETGEKLSLAGVKRVIEDAKTADGKANGQVPARGATLINPNPPPVSKEILQQRAAAADRIRALMEPHRDDDFGPAGPVANLDEPDLDEAAELDREMANPGDSEETIWRRERKHRADVAASYADRGEWSRFAPDAELKQMVKKVADAWGGLLAHLEHTHAGDNGLDIPGWMRRSS